MPSNILYRWCMSLWLTVKMELSVGGPDYFSAAAPDMISTSSLVMTACRWRLYMIVILSIISPAKTVRHTCPSPHLKNKGTPVNHNTPVNHLNWETVSGTPVNHSTPVNQSTSDNHLTCKTVRDNTCQSQRCTCQSKHMSIISPENSGTPVKHPLSFECTLIDIFILQASTRAHSQGTYY